MQFTYTDQMVGQNQPAYALLAHRLAKKIEAGEYEGRSLPSISQLADEHAVTTGVAQRAMAQLDKWRLITVEHGRASRPRADGRRITRNIPDRYQWEKDRAREPDASRRSSGVAEQETDLPSNLLRLKADFAQIPCSPELAALLEVVPGSMVHQRRFEITPADEPHALATGQGSWIPLELVDGVDVFMDPNLEPFPGGTLAQFATIGIEIASIEDVIRTRPAWPSEAPQLGLEIGDIVVDLTKISRSTAGRVVEVASIVLDGRRTELRYTSQLERWQGAD